MAVIQLDITELSDVLDMLQDRGIEFATSYEPGRAYIYGTDDTIQQVDDILWASDVLDALGQCFSEELEQVKFVGDYKIEV